MKKIIRRKMIEAEDQESAAEYAAKNPRPDNALDRAMKSSAPVISHVQTAIDTVKKVGEGDYTGAALGVAEKIPGKVGMAVGAARTIGSLVKETSDDNINKISDIASQFKAMASEPKVGIKKLPDVNASGVPDMFKVKKIQEEGEGGGAPANSAGGGQIAGIGIPNASKPANWGEPGISKKVQKKHTNILRRKKPVALQEAKMGKFAGHNTFIVSSDKYHTAKTEKKKGKHWKNYIGEDECGQQIREYANKNHKKPIILQDESTGAMCYARYGKK